MTLNNYDGVYIDVSTLIKLCEKQGSIELNDFIRSPMLKLVHCNDCKYAIPLPYKDEETGEDLLGCTHLVNGLEEEGYCMTVRPYSHCSWGRLNHG